MSAVSNANQPRHAFVSSTVLLAGQYLAAEVITQLFPLDGGGPALQDVGVNR